ncbi:serine/threonine-protein kinase [Limnofasciculus baicalensis]|uniref:Serine/threonine-protein kinase n=1 Tax=Limnofasciculus baicalensis BBK-W-15 TaxID=2699891 RepID=A0AAE3GRH9_9CYAN|nr:serine/threonine-protein kinase [Limnofasciculus baicalensis]MCP2728523.1 serine/threonine-protein kinase [Limnofasciculus baicalensis BBK-W-15]
MSNSTLGGRYQIVNHLGGGGFGQTYLAEDLHLPGNPHCVVKQLNPQFQGTSFGKEAKRLFDREAQVLYNLGGDFQIPRLLACFEEEGEFYLVQEFIPGNDLKQEIESIQSLNENLVIELLQDILEVLILIHQENIIHRDIKPANIIRRETDHKFILIDFGAATQINTQKSSSPSYRSMTIPICTPGYTPEEQLRGKPCFSSDIYGLGMTAIESITGLHPLDIPEDSKSRKLIWRDKVQVSFSLANILDKMVSYDFGKRYQSAQEVLDDLEKLNGGNKTAINIGNNRLTATIKSINSRLRCPVWVKPSQFIQPAIISLLLVIICLTIYLISQSCLNKFSNKKFCQVSNVPSGIFSYGGSTVWVSIRKEIDPVIQKELPNFRLRYTQPDGEVPSSHAGIRMLLNNQIDFAQFSVLINEKEYQMAGERGIRFKQIPVAIDGAGIAVHPSLNIAGLTVEQFHKIYAGKITNWNQIGGPNLEITPYGKKDRDFGNHIIFVPTTTEAFRQLANNPGGIYYTSATLVLSQCSVKPLPVGHNINTLVPPYKEPFVPLSQCPQKYNKLNMKAFETGEYPLSRRLSVVIKQNSQIEEEAGEAYANLLLTNQGQELLEKVGFVRIR